MRRPIFVDVSVFAAPNQARISSCLIRTRRGRLGALEDVGESLPSRPRSSGSQSSGEFVKGFHIMKIRVDLPQTL